MGVETRRNSGININGNAEHFATASGNRGPADMVEGMLEAFGTLTVIPENTDRWDGFREFRKNNDPKTINPQRKY